MKYGLKIALFCVLSFVGSFASTDRTPAGNVRTDTVPDDQVPYHLSFRQGGVLFVEDNSGSGPTLHPDSLWNAILTTIFGAGNFGWFGPTISWTDDGPDLATMQNYDVVIWNNYDHWDTPTLTNNDTLNIGAYLDGGGHVWLIGQDILFSSFDLIPFVQARFNLDFYYEAYLADVPITNLMGLAEIASDTFETTCDYQNNDYFSDDLTPDANAHNCLIDVMYNACPAILCNDSSATFWTIDGRRPDPSATWLQMVVDMLELFGVTGIEEFPDERVSIEGPSIACSPNTFRNFTTFTYFVPSPGQVRITIYDKTGAQVITLIDGYHGSGSHAVDWQGAYADGTRVASGVYFAAVNCGDFQCTTKFVVVQ
jgi:hypothetical protein